MNEILEKYISRQTIQKSIVLDYLRSVKTHPSAEMVYRAVRERLPQISLGTVYRNLEKFAAQGKILKITVSQKSRYDGDNSTHGHFFCEVCGKIDDVFDGLPKLDKLKAPQGKIKYTHFYFFGTCRKCLK